MNTNINDNGEKRLTKRRITGNRQTDNNPIVSRIFKRFCIDVNKVLNAYSKAHNNVPTNNEFVMTFENKKKVLL